MSTLGVHSHIVSPTSMSLRRRVFMLAMAVIIVVTLVIAGVMAGTRGTSATSAGALPQHRDMAPTRLFRDPQTHALVWTAAGHTPPAADSTPQQPLRPRYPGK